jgi:maltose O-acetyltransferase
MRRAGLRIDSTAFFEPGVIIVGDKLNAGPNLYVNRLCLIDCRATVAIGPGTLIGPRVMIITATHPIMEDLPRAGPTTFKPITIGAGVWIGAGATLLPGCIIGDGCVIGAGALVRGTLEPGGTYVGVPAKPKKMAGRPEG